MDEKIPQNILYKISLIADKVQEYTNRYDMYLQQDNLLSLEMSKAIIGLLKELFKLVQAYDIQQIEIIALDIPSHFLIDRACVICEQVELFKFLNSLKDDNFSIAFDNKWKDRIRTYVVTIKSILDSANIENERLKNSIFFKLSAFEKELDQTKTSLQKFEMAFVDLTYAIGAGCKNLEPAYKLFYKVMKSFGKLTDIAEHPQLPPPDDHKLLPPPDDNEDEQ